MYQQQCSQAAICDTKNRSSMYMYIQHSLACVGTKLDRTFIFAAHGRLWHAEVEAEVHVGKTQAVQFQQSHFLDFTQVAISFVVQTKLSC